MRSRITRVLSAAFLASVTAVAIAIPLRWHGGPGAAEWRLIPLGPPSIADAAALLARAESRQVDAGFFTRQISLGVILAYRRGRFGSRDDPNP